MSSSYLTCKVLSSLHHLMHNPINCMLFSGFNFKCTLTFSSNRNIICIESYDFISNTFSSCLRWFEMYHILHVSFFDHAFLLKSCDKLKLMFIKLLFLKWKDINSARHKCQISSNKKRSYVHNNVLVLWTQLRVLTSVRRNWMSVHTIPVANV